MQSKNIENFQHSHSLGHDVKRPGEVGTFVIAITASMMILEIATSIAFVDGTLRKDCTWALTRLHSLSMPLLIFMRDAKEQRFSFGTGKVNTLGGHTGAVLLAVFA